MPSAAEGTVIKILVLGDPATEAAITGTAEADRCGDVLMAEIERLKGREGFAKGTLPPAAL